jgi:hypothetical protein
LILIDNIRNDQKFKDWIARGDQQLGEIRKEIHENLHLEETKVLP